MTLRHKQHGATLLVALVMLVVLTLLVVSAIRSSTTNLRVAGNMQMQGEATASAQQAIEQVISGNFTANPVSAVIPVDINNSGTPQYTAAVSKPACTGSVPLMNSSLDMNNPNDVPCFSSSTASNTGIISTSGVQATSGQSWCFAQQWDIPAEATSVTGTGADVTVHQGVSLRVPAGTTC
ncbi:PilX N-terminal domain-containing pilus assembly protein [Sideroxydans lithotrophicus]|uniref:Putative transmembrane protein n=1 Tax=Sideroxydans lithotrophicus (strain ES-1) TaxID=580332 RepID=D5CUK4_SIDLE|nr:PilX N-terminal domain-containing pilus assembly protein [Sideroxydans lithotrophicus]ADE12391.1 putative transmembrane protein [Sideroxydans lithotrophicus ES-1]